MCRNLEARANSLSSYIYARELDCAEDVLTWEDGSRCLVHVVLSSSPGEPRAELWGDASRGYVVVSCGDGVPVCREIVDGTWRETLFYLGIVPVDVGAGD